MLERYSAAVAGCASSLAGISVPLSALAFIVRHQPSVFANIATERLEHFANAAEDIFVTPSPMVTLVREEHW